MHSKRRIAIAFTFVLAGLSGCTIHPAGEAAQRREAASAGKPFQRRFEDRVLLPLPDNPTADDLVRHAILANAELEQKYWEWVSAIEQVPIDGTQTTTLALSGGMTVTNGRTGARNSTLTLLNDPMTDIHWPGTLAVAARRSLENAKAAALRFRKAKYDLRGKVLDACYDLALTAELIRLERANAQLLTTTAMVVEARNRAGAAGQQDLLKARNELDLSRNEIAAMQAQLPAQLASLNALLSRSPQTALSAPPLPGVTPLAYNDGQLLQMAAENNPELAALAAEVRSRKEGVQLARLQYVPDFDLSVGSDLMGVAQSLAGTATVPLLRYEAINASIAQAEANLRASEAMRRQARNDLNAQVVMDLRALRDADRQLDLFEHTILPRARQAVTVARSAYEAGQATLLDLLDSQRSLLAVERLVANLRVARQKHLTDFETIAGRSFR